MDDLPGLWRPPRAGAAVSLDGQVRRVLPQAQHARPASAGQVPLLRRLAEHQCRHAQGRHLHRLLRPQHQLTAEAAEVLGKTEDAASIHDLYRQIKAAFNRAYVGADGRIKGNTQACYVLALAVDLVDGEKAKQAARYLVEDIEKRGGHLSTGFIGTKDLMLVLSKIGRHDVAYRLLFNDTFPSWGFSIKHGATSIWERWDGWTPEKGFQDPGMNSFAHYSFGAVYQWMVENIGGIKSDGPAYKQILIEPHPGGRLTHAETSYQSIRGEIATAWTKEGGKLTLNVTIPANTTATVILPPPDQTPSPRAAAP